MTRPEVIGELLKAEQVAKHGDNYVYESDGYWWEIQLPDFNIRVINKINRRQVTIISNQRFADLIKNEGKPVLLEYLKRLQNK